MATNGTLNFADALSYLDLIESEFRDHPETYNAFLGVMKDFKSQTVDTPGVIERITYLFQGHPTILEGFNAFLPSGYAINYAPDQLSGISVSTPSGTWIPTLVAIPDSRVETNDVVDPTTTTTASSDEQVTSPATAPSDSNTTNTDPKVVIALNFLHKVKTRYANKPEIYQQFLDLFSSPDAVHDVNTPTRIATLFEDSPDLKEALSAFLPFDRNIRLVLSKL